MTKNKSRQHGGNVQSGGGRKRRYNNHTSSGSAAQPVFAVSGQFIGTIEGDVFTKRVKSSKHMLRQPPAWALDDAVLRDLAGRGVSRVVYIDTETGHEYCTTVDTFTSKGRLFDRGYGAQVFLTLGYWSVDGASPALARREPDPNAGVQLALFGGEGGSDGRAA